MRPALGALIKVIMKRDKLTLSPAQHTALVLQIRAELKPADQRRCLTPTVGKDRSQRKHFAAKETNTEQVVMSSTPNERKHFYQAPIQQQSTSKFHRERKHFPQSKNSTLNLSQQFLKAKPHAYPDKAPASRDYFRLYR